MFKGAEQNWHELDVAKPVTREKAICKVIRPLEQGYNKDRRSLEMLGINSHKYFIRK